MTKKIKTVISAVLAAAMVSAGGVTVYAEPEDTATELETDVSESTTTRAADNAMSAPETTLANTERTPAETSAPVTEPITQPATTTTTKLENPFETGMLADDELYSFIMGYLNEGVEFDIDGTGVLVDESVIRGYEENSAFSENEDGSGEDDENGAGGYIKGSTEKIMYTVTTRDGSMFYIVIDKAKSGENVYFLNNVDIVDLASVINRQAEVDEDGNAVLNRQERDIVNEASNVSITTAPIQRPNDESGDNGDGEDDPEGDDENSDDENDEESSGGSTTLYLIIGAAAVAVIGFAWYKKMGPGSQKTKAAFTEDEDEDEPEEETVTEEDDNIPLEDDYEEEE